MKTFKAFVFDKFIQSMTMFSISWRVFDVIKGALDKYDIYLFISNSIEDFKLDLY